MIAQAMMRFDNPGSVAEYFGEQLFYNEEIWLPEKRVEEIGKITKLEIDTLAKKIFNFSKLNIGLLGDVSSEILKEIKDTFKK